MNSRSNDFEEEKKSDNKKLLKRINRGLSAKRYLNSLTKHWDQSLLDAFISDGKIKQENIYNKNGEKAMKRKRADDDLTLMPQAYRFDQNWFTGTVDMRSYKFLKAQDFNLSKDYQGKKHYLLNIFNIFKLTFNYKIYIRQFI